ncbi:hypothetical protein O181_094081 [Austropuccinia psidii MF-1]|uniref:Uncharacterized protein n=1 Tax=Austropuccinia psidii MF-1 TaxID=1389203 RepID=A0A9Q3J2J2_9BASI|nr:hypothetical protein [Austropuccinia psidii MF-1]
MWTRKSQYQIQKCQIFVKKDTYGGCQSCPHSPRSVPTNFDMDSESGMIHYNILRAEPLSSGSNRNLSMPVQKLVQSSQRRGVRNMPKPLAGGHELLFTHQELSGSREDYRTLRRPEEGVGNDSSFEDRRPSSIYQLQTSSRSVQRQAQRTSEEEERSKEPSRKGQSQSQLAQTLPTRLQDSQIGAFSNGQCLQYAQDSYAIYSQGAGKDEQSFSMQIIDEIHFVKSSIDVEPGKFDAKLNKIILDMSEFKRNDKKYTEWYQLTNVRLDSITNTCDRIETKNTNQFGTHLEKSDSERQKLKNEIIAHVEQIHKNYEPQIPRYSTSLTEEKLSVKGSLTPFLGKNPICAKDIPKLDKWPAISGEGEYNHIEFIRTIDMLQEDFHIPNEIIVGKLHSLLTRTAKKWYYKMRLHHGKHDWSWWKS